MKTRKIDAVVVWKHIDDSLVPRLELNVIDRAVYSYLLRHSHLEGKRHLRFSMAWLARGIRVSDGAARPALRRLLDRGALRLLRRTKFGHEMEVLLPREIRGAVALRTPARPNLFRTGNRSQALPLDAIDFLQNQMLRRSIHTREGSRCFYCLRSLT